MTAVNLGEGNSHDAPIGPHRRAVALTAACNNGPAAVAGTAAPAIAATSATPTATDPTLTPTVAPAKSSPSSTPSSSTPPTSAPPTSSKPSPKPSTDLSRLTIYPAYVGQLHVGMSAAAARATGEIASLGTNQDPAACTYATWRGYTSDAPITFNGRYGIRAIQGFGRQHTPGGVRIGSSLADVTREFPKVDLGENDMYDPAAKEGFLFPDPVAGDGAHYRLRLAHGKVTELGLESDRGGCYE